MRVLISGSSGLLGTELCSNFEKAKHDVWRLVRQSTSDSSRPKTIPWDIPSSRLDEAQLEGFDLVIHLSGENVGARRWTPAQKENIRRSRVDSTTLLASRLARCTRKPSTFICASATGYYGHSLETTWTEASPPGQGFLAQTCSAWESAAKPAAQSGIRVVHTRFGVVLSQRGGALQKILPPFKLCLGGRLGSGKQWMSWISLTDAIRAVEFCSSNSELSGPINCVSPNPVTNAEFTETLGDVLHRPTPFPVPGFIIRALLGEMGQDLLLSSVRVAPTRLEESGFRFEEPTLRDALRACLHDRGGGAD